MVLNTQYLRKAEFREDKGPLPKGFPFSLQAVRQIEAIEFHPNVTFLVGENGSGKSTLLEAIAVAWGFNAEGGSRNFNFSTHNSHSDLHKFLKLSKGVRRPQDGYFLRAESFFNVATTIEELDKEPPLSPNDFSIIDAYGGQSLHEQSHGESFFALIMERFHGRGLYILDEPEAALSPQRQLALISRVHELVNQDSQFLIATHSPILMAYPNASIFVLDGSGIKKMNYEDTEHYQVTKGFINNYSKMLKVLMGG